MAMLDIEYRYSGEPTYEGSRRKSVKDMEGYIRSLVLEMQMADISVGFKMVPIESGRNDVTINGRNVGSILEGLNIVPLEPDDEGCGCGTTDKKPLINIGRSDRDWNKDCIEDISDVLMKNAIAKVYSEMEAGRIL